MTYTAAPGINNVGEYQVAGQPFVKTFTLGAAGNNGDGGAEEIFGDIAAAQKVVDDSASAIDFPTITKRIVISNTSAADIFVYFCSTMVPSQTGGGGGGADLDENNQAVDIISRGNKITTAELNAYHSGVRDNRPKAAVKENGHYYTVADNVSLELNVKCRRIYIAGAGGDSVSLLAELTNIDRGYDCDFRGIAGISGGIPGSMYLKGQQA